MLNVVTFVRMNNNGELVMAGGINTFSVKHYFKKMRKQAEKVLKEQGCDYVVYGLCDRPEHTRQKQFKSCMIPMSHLDYFKTFESLKDVEILSVQSVDLT